MSTTETRNPIKTHKKGLFLPVLVLTCCLTIVGGFSVARSEQGPEYWKQKYESSMKENKALHEQITDVREERDRLLASQLEIRGMMNPNMVSFHKFAHYNLLHNSSEPISITGMEMDTVHNILKLKIRTTENYQYQWDDKKVAKTGNILDLDLTSEGEKKHSKKKLDIIGQSQKFTVIVEYYPREYFKDRGLTTAGKVIVETELPYRDQMPNPFARILKDRYRMQQFMGREILTLQPSARAARLVIFLADAIAKAPMNWSRHFSNPYGPAILDEILTGKSYADCWGRSIIARDYFLAAEIEARINMLYAKRLPIDKDTMLCFSQDHTCSEMWMNGKWNWFDLQLMCLYAKRPNDPTWLSTWELMILVNDPEKRHDLVFGVYSPNTGRTVEIRLEEDPGLAYQVRTLYTIDKDLHYQ